MFSRTILIVLDGVGVGALPDAAAYNDSDAATLQHVAAAVGGLQLPNLERLGLGHIAPVKGVRPRPQVDGLWGKMAEKSAGKDSVTGHWELSGVILDEPFATFPSGFPEPVIAAFRRVSGSEPLGNIAASGTDIIRRLGAEHLASGRPIVYTSSDSVFQIAAHEDILPPEDLYTLCRKMERELIPYNICRVIARPFRGSSPENFYRTSGRHDFPRKPGGKTLLTLLQESGISTCGIGKIKDLYAGQGLNESFPTKHNRAGMAETLQQVKKIRKGFIMTNLVDFDMLYGHRLDVHGFADALEEFDRWLPKLFSLMDRSDLLIITADHGCDPTTAGTDHSREYVPLLAWFPGAVGGSLGVRKSFADVGATIAENYSLSLAYGHSFYPQLIAKD